jgi:hypothetical protein
MTRPTTKEEIIAYVLDKPLPETLGVLRFSLGQLARAGEEGILPVDEEVLERGAKAFMETAAEFPGAPMKPRIKKSHFMEGLYVLAPFSTADWYHGAEAAAEFHIGCRGVILLAERFKEVEAHSQQFEESHRRMAQGLESTLPAGLSPAVKEAATQYMQASAQGTLRYFAERPLLDVKVLERYRSQLSAINP